MTAGGSFDRNPRSATAGIIWPALASPAASRRLGLLQQFEDSQWWPQETLRAWQFRQLGALLEHARRTVPFYAQRLREAGFVPGQELTPEVWARIPLLTREEIQDAGDALTSRKLPASHGGMAKTTTSGSTGKPVTVFKSAIAQLFWEAVTLRNHLWQRRDFSGKLAVIRSLADGTAAYPKGSHSRNWGRATAIVFPTGPAVLLNVDTAVRDQAAWLARHNPDYLLTLPTNLLDLAGHCAGAGIALPRLRDVGTLGGVLSARARDACRRAWNVRVADMYSAQEVGYIALQCPDHEHYHIQAEVNFVEILDPGGRACAPGECGRVVVTPLHGFAMPLIRYDLGDFAELGPPCACGRGLPVMRRILGRVRNMLARPDGTRLSPTFVNDWFEGLPVRQFQIVQSGFHDLEFRVVPRRPFTAAEEDSVRRLIAVRLGPEFRVAFTYHGEIARGSGGKFEDFKCEVGMP